MWIVSSKSTAKSATRKRKSGPSQRVKQSPRPSPITPNQNRPAVPRRSRLNMQVSNLTPALSRHPPVPVLPVFLTPSSQLTDPPPASIPQQVVGHQHQPLTPAARHPQP